MSKTTPFDLSGDRELVRKLTKLAKKDFSKATRAGARTIANKTKALAPVETGALRKAVKVKSVKSRTAVGHKVVLAFKGGAVSNLFYGGFQEYGTKHIKAKGFMKRAADEEGKKAMQATIDILKTAIIREVS